MDSPNMIWTPTARNDFIDTAVNSMEEKGKVGNYWFNTMPRNEHADIENPKKTEITGALMKTIFENPQYRIFALKIYDILINKITSNQFTRSHFHKNIMVLLKGGTAYTYLTGMATDVFPYSDLDIVIYINPNLPTVVFNTIKETLNTIVLQTISQYKRSIDFMFFSNKERMTEEQVRRQMAEQFISDDIISQFKEDYVKNLNDISTEEGTYVSPFEGNEFRNAASKHSFIIEHSRAQENTVVRVEVPHFHACERIPLKKTPMYCSYNSTINFNRVEGNDNLKGIFDLYRIRFNNLYIFKDPEDEEKSYRENITADFIDISIAGQDDAELRDFWNYGSTILVNDYTANMWLVIPDARSMLDDLYKMLTLYECPEGKKEKRIRRFEAIKEIVQGYTAGFDYPPPPPPPPPPPYPSPSSSASSTPVTSMGQILTSVGQIDMNRNYTNAEISTFSPELCLDLFLSSAGYPTET
jgi:hypothetical protein